MKYFWTLNIFILRQGCGNLRQQLSSFDCTGHVLDWLCWDQEIWDDIIDDPDLIYVFQPTNDEKKSAFSWLKQLLRFVFKISKWQGSSMDAMRTENWKKCHIAINMNISCDLNNVRLK